MDLIDEEDVALPELGQDRREVSRSFQRRTRGDMKLHLAFGGDDSREGRLAESRRASEEQMIDHLGTASRRLQDNLEVLLQFSLTDELVERPRSETAINRIVR